MLLRIVTERIKVDDFDRETNETKIFWNSSLSQVLAIFRTSNTYHMLPIEGGRMPCQLCSQELLASKLVLLNVVL